MKKNSETISTLPFRVMTVSLATILTVRIISGQYWMIRSVVLLLFLLISGAGYSSSVFLFRHGVGLHAVAVVISDFSEWLLK